MGSLHLLTGKKKKKKLKLIRFTNEYDVLISLQNFDKEFSFLVRTSLAFFEIVKHKKIYWEKDGGHLWT